MTSEKERWENKEKDLQNEFDNTQVHAAASFEDIKDAPYIKENYSGKLQLAQNELNITNEKLIEIEKEQAENAQISSQTQAEVQPEQNKPQVTSSNPVQQEQTETQAQTVKQREQSKAQAVTSSNANPETASDMEMTAPTSTRNMRLDFLNTQQDLHTLTAPSTPITHTSEEEETLSLS